MCTKGEAPSSSRGIPDKLPVSALAYHLACDLVDVGAIRHSVAVFIRCKI